MRTASAPRLFITRCLTRMRIYWTDVPRWSRIGFIGVVAVYGGIAAYSIVSLVWVGSADSYLHLDYAYQVWHGDLPAGYGTELTISGPPPHVASSDATHFTASHPPLFYAMVAPVVGPLVDSGHWQMAVLTVRLFNLGVGLAILVLLGHFALQFGGRRRHQMVIALPAMVVLVTAFLNGASDVYNDLLVTFFAILTLILAAHVIRDGPSLRLIFALGIVSAAGMATKATFVVTMAIAVGAVVVASVMHGKGANWSRILAAIRRSSIVVGLPVIAIGWFYAWNTARSGLPFRARPKTPVGERQLRSLVDNLTDLDFYLVFPRGVLGNPAWETPARLNWIGSLILVGVGALVWVAYLIFHRQRSGSHRLTALLAVMLVLQVIGHYVAQLEHSTGYGALNFRYFLPALMAVGLVLSVGWVSWGRVTAMVVPIQMMILVAAKIVGGILWLSKNHYSLVSQASDLGHVTAGATANGVPPIVPWFFLAIAGVGCAVVAWALWRSYDVQEERSADRVKP